MTDFAATGYGRRFFDAQLPDLVAAMKTLPDPVAALEGIIAEGLAKPPAPTPDAALDAITHLLDGHVWDADTCSAVADVLRDSGRIVRDPEDA